MNEDVEEDSSREPGFNGDAIEIVETKAYNANSEVLFSGYARGSKKMPDSWISTCNLQSKIALKPEAPHTRAFLIDSLL